MLVIDHPLFFDVIRKVTTKRQDYSALERFSISETVALARRR